MREGMGWLMDLCPPPEELTLGDWCKPFGILPSQVHDMEDWRFLAAYSSLKTLVGSYRNWKNMMQILAENPHAGVSMPMDTIQWMLGLMEEAKKEYGKED